ncbi:MAG: hypothetical protein JXB00_04730 [Bacteroidales bacterium]|nr:hypothetical protein [Bacteroidales bacterium]
MSGLLHKDLSNKIINCFYTVYNTLGFGFLEKVYENALFFPKISPILLNGECFTIS